MHKGIRMILKALPIFCLVGAFDADAATINATSCSKAGVTMAYNAASNGDTIVVPAGNCSSSNVWTSALTISKQVTIQGAGIDTTIIGLSGNGPVFRIYANNVRLTGFTFDCKNQDTTDQGFVQIGTTSSTTACDNVYTIVDFRVDHNRFINCAPSPLPSDGVTGWSAISASGYVYGVIDNNTFDNCNGECLDIGADGTGNKPSSPLSLARSLEYGGYANGTIYIEDNTWNYNTAINPGDYGAENAIDGNSGSRWVMRYNTFNIASNSRVQAIISNHETCATRSCDGATQGDVGSLMMEIYGNKVYNSGGSGFGFGEFVTQRGGRALVYSNTIYTKDSDDSNIVRLSNLRSYHRPGCNAQTARGYSQYCHESDGSGLITEGLQGGNLVFGSCLEQINNSYVWGNKTVGGADKNGVGILTGTAPDYSLSDIQSYAQRPQNWQYRNDGTAYSYTPYPYPHPLRGESQTLLPPRNLRIVN